MVWHTIPRPIQSLFPKRIWKSDSSENQVYLTFDDGPIPGVTDFVLEELAKRNQVATFFMVGDNLQKFPELGWSVLKSGHRIGNHTFNHLNGWKTPDSVYLKNIQAFDQVVEGTLGIQTELFRPPYGLLKNSQAKILLKTKKVVMWSVLSGDYDLSIDRAQVLEKSNKYTKPGSIVLFHDQLKTKEVIKAVLPDFLDFLSEHDYKTALL